MPITYQGVKGSFTNPSASVSSFPVTLTTAIPVGSFAIIAAGWDRTAATDPFAATPVTDPRGNTWNVPVAPTQRSGQTYRGWAYSNLTSGLQVGDVLSLNFASSAVRIGSAAVVGFTSAGYSTNSANPAGTSGTVVNQLWNVTAPVTGGRMFEIEFTSNGAGTPYTLASGMVELYSDTVATLRSLRLSWRTNDTNAGSSQQVGFTQTATKIYSGVAIVMSYSPVASAYVHVRTPLDGTVSPALNDGTVGNTAERSGTVAPAVSDGTVAPYTSNGNVS